MRKKGENEMQFIALFFHEMEEELRFIFGCFDSIWEAVVRVVMSQRAHNLLNCVNVKAPTQSAAQVAIRKQHAEEALAHDGAHVSMGHKSLAGCVWLLCWLCVPWHHASP